MRRPALLLAALLAGAAPANVASLRAETIAITGGTLAIGDGSPPVANGTVVIRDGRVVAAGAGVAVPPGARTVDAAGKWVSAGIVGGIEGLGIVDVSGVQETNDAAARQSPFSAAIDVSPVIDTNGQSFAVERQGGVTRSIVAPDAANTIFAGQGAVIGLAAGGRDPVLRPRAFQYVELGEEASRHGGGTRPAAHVLLGQMLAAARNPALAGELAKDALFTRADALALLPVVEGRMSLLVHAERTTDIRAALALKARFPALKLVLVGATEGWMIAPEIAAAHVPVIAAALADLPERFETLAATQSNVGRLAKAGVPVAICTIDGSGGGSSQQRNLTQYAGNLVALTKVDGATGLDWGQAFAAITSRPAEALGMGGEIGSLRPGRRGDVVIWDGDPLELASAPVAVLIDGVAQPLTTRQTRLRDRYATPQEGALPKAYER